MRTSLPARILLVALALLQGPLHGCTAADASAAAPRLVAIGDLHGDLDNAISAAALAGVVDAEGHWIGGNAVLVQTGDITDRGPDSRGLLDWMDRLSVESRSQGGRVISLLGNHEVMNLTGDWRYVHPGDVQAFGGEQARRLAFSAEGTYGARLRDTPVAALVDGTVFVHGGIHPDFARGGLDALNAQARTALSAPLAQARQAAVLGSDGPLWFRGYVEAPEPDACPLLGQALTSLGARRMVVGHTTRRDGRIESRCGGRLHVIDIGIADGYGAHLGVWTAQGPDAVAIYPTGRVDLEDPT